MVLIGLMLFYGIVPTAAVVALPAFMLLAVVTAAGVVGGFRWALLGTGQAPRPLLAVSAGVAILLLVSGLFYFRRMEKAFADVV